MEAEINAHPLGHELRVYVSGSLHYSRVHRALADAEAEAEGRKQELSARGWLET
jgi:hypothetical protein